MKKDKMLTNFIEELKRQCGRRLRDIILFGSRARGDATKESDYDLLLIFDRVGKTEKAIIDEAADKYLLEYGAVFATFVFSQEELKKMSYEPFIINIKKEGVRL